MDSWKIIAFVVFLMTAAGFAWIVLWERRTAEWRKKNFMRYFPDIFLEETAALFLLVTFIIVAITAFWFAFS